jgi:hypothetical protein
MISVYASNGENRFNSVGEFRLRHPTAMRCKPSKTPDQEPCLGKPAEEREMIDHNS